MKTLKHPMKTNKGFHIITTKSGTCKMKELIEAYLEHAKGNPVNVSNIYSRNRKNVMVYRCDVNEWVSDKQCKGYSEQITVTELLEFMWSKIK